VRAEPGRQTHFCCPKCANLLKASPTCTIFGLELGGPWTLLTLPTALLRHCRPTTRRDAAFLPRRRPRTPTPIRHRLPVLPVLRTTPRRPETGDAREAHTCSKWLSREQQRDLTNSSPYGPACSGAAVGTNASGLGAASLGRSSRATPALAGVHVGGPRPPAANPHRRGAGDGVGKSESTATGRMTVMTPDETDWRPLADRVDAGLDMESIY